MTQEPVHGDFEREEGIPPALAADLRSLYRTGADERTQVPHGVDEAVMAAARERFAGMNPGERRGGLFVVVRRIGLVGGPLAAAAVLALVVWLTPWRPGVPQGPVPMPGMGRQQAQGLLEKEADKRMIDDRLAFEEAEGEERARSFADAGDEANGAGDTLATMADAAGRRDAGEFARKSERSASAPAPMLAAEAAPRWAEDFNADGVVDMRDALMMARVVERGPWSMGLEWDLNGDGVVNEDDVRAVALAAVDLERRGEVVR